MKQFLKFFLASVLGIIVGSILLFFIFIAIISALATSFDSEKSVSIKGPHILEIKLEHPIAERTSRNPFDNIDPFTFKPTSQPGLNDIIACIDKAAADDNIKGIYLHNSSMSAGLAAIEEIRNAIKRFKSTGKFVISYADYYDQGAYYLATAADSVFLNDQGAVDFRGLLLELMFMRGLFDKLEVEPQLIRHGKFKSAAESFTEYKMSDENKLQIKAMVDGFWLHMVNEIAASRKLSPDEVQMAADSVKGLDPEQALASRLVDRLVYEDEIIAMLQRETGKREKEDPALISLSKYKRVSPKDLKYQKDRIAIIYGTGPISSGEGDDLNIGSDRIAAAIRKARKDEKIKAIVFRVNSPGGSALASDVIWREIKLAKQSKPVVVSMGDVAASGGYYISCAADSVFAQPNSVTGSIGVIGLLFNLESFLKNKLGITTDSYKSAALADIGFPTHKMTERERMVLTGMIERIYHEFTMRVAEGRNLGQNYVDSIGQGRVWTGRDAMSIGLVDRMGGIHEAIACASRMAGITQYKVVELPEQKDPFTELLSGMSAEARLSLLGFDKTEKEYLRAVLKYTKLSGAQALLPFEFHVK